MVEIEEIVIGSLHKGEIEVHDFPFGWEMVIKRKKHLLRRIIKF